jgi:integrase
MMESVPRPRPPHLHRQTTRHGKAVWYVRLDKGKRIRIRSEFGTPEFDSEYQVAIAGTPRRKTNAPPLGTLTWLIDRYRESAAWSVLSPGTRRQRENIFLHVLETAGDKPFVKINTAAINAGLERRAKTPFQARHFLDAMRGVFKWAVKNNHVKIDPTANVDRPQRITSDGIPAWTEEMVEAYERRWPIGTRERVWLDILLYTGLRVGDAFRFGKQHVRAGEMKTEKTGQIVYPEILPVLAETLAAGPVGDLTYIIGGNGRSFTNKGAFGNAFVRAARAAGVRGSAHGVRKLSATRAADNGASEAMLEATYGWTGGRMASLYTRTANRRRLAKETMHKLNAS